jgi:REP element-mobilizing transposase RayT
MGSTLTNILLHIVFSTKDRDPLITSKYKTRLHAYIGGIIVKEQAVPIDIGGVEDHIHIAVRIKPNDSVSDLVRSIKANSSKWINESHLSETCFAWQGGYAAFSVSESQLVKLKDYINNQEEHHRQRTFRDELLKMLEKHNIDFDEKYLWN